MIESYKSETIAALHRIAEKYTTPGNESFCDSKHCSLCAVYRIAHDGDCYGCVYATVEGNPGCVTHPTYQAVLEQTNGDGKMKSNYDKAIVAKRIELTRRIIEAAEKIDAKYFLPSAKSEFSLSEHPYIKTILSQNA